MKNEAMLLEITLGNPLQECRQFGICRIEPWNGRALQPQGCLAVAGAKANALELGLPLLFLKRYLKPEMRRKHFHPCFRVEAPLLLPTFLSPGTRLLLPGRYTVSHRTKALRVVLRLSEEIMAQPECMPCWAKEAP